MQSLKLIIDIFFVKLNIDKKYFSLVVILNILIVVMELIGISAIIPLLQFITNNKVELFFFNNIDDEDILLFISVLFVLFLTIKFTITLIIENVNRKYSESMNSLLSQYIFSKYLSLKYEYVLNQTLSKITRTVHSDSLRFTDSFTTFIRLAMLLIMCISFFFVMAYFSFFYTLFIIFIGLVITPFFYLTLYKKLRNLGAKWINDEKEILDMINSAYANFKDLEIFKLNIIFQKNFNSSIKSLLSSKYKTIFINTITRNLIELLGLVLILLFIIFYYLNGSDINEILFKLGIFAFILFRLIPVVNQIIINFNKINIHEKSIINVYDLLTNNNINRKIVYSGKVKFLEIIKFDNINFEYEGKKVFNNLNISFQKGTINAILGPNGSGKTTLINILTGNLKPNSGKVSVDNKELDLTSQEWIDKISLVSQDFNIPNINIRDFLVHEENNDSEMHIKNLFKEFNLDEVLLQRTLKDSKGLSVGQVQKLCIIRALIKDSEVIFFDETTSALDIDSINRLVAILKKIENKTIIFITHDIKSLNLFDKINIIKLK